MGKIIVQKDRQVKQQQGDNNRMNSNGQSSDSSNRDSCSQHNSSSQNMPQPEPETIEQRFNKILIQADLLIAQQQYPEAVTKLNLLSEKINFLKQNRKDYDKKLELVCLYNLAAAYHKQWILDECIPLVDKFIIMLKSAIVQQESRQDAQQNRTKSHYWYKMKHLLIKTQLQYCAILSQVGDHYKALKIAIEVSDSLKEFFNKGYNEVCKFLNKINKIDSKKSLASSWGSDTELSPLPSVTNDKVEFATNVLIQSKQNLTELLKIQTYEEVVKQNFAKISQQLIDLKSRTYFWKNNPQNNIKLLRKQLYAQKQTVGISSGDDGQERNLLGIKKSKSWIEQITIAKIMVMSPINYLEFAQKDNIIFQFNYKNLVDKIILVSVTYFSLAIELRFIENTQAKQKEKKQQQNTLLSPDKNSQNNHKDKQGQKQTNKQMKKSQVFHLKSVVLLCKLIKENSAFLNHLVMNYHKHYKQDLITIEEESSMAEYSHIYDCRSKSNSLLTKNVDNQFILPVDQDQQDREGDVLSSTSKFPRESAYFQDNAEDKILPVSPKNSKKNPLIAFKKVPEKKDFDISQEKSKKYVNSISITRNDPNNKEIKTAGYPKYINQKEIYQDQTMKKISVGKIIALGSPGKFGLDTDRSKDRSTQKEASLSKFHSMRSFEKKSFSTRSIPSISLGKTTSMNSTTLKHKKRRGEKSPQKQKFKLKDLKESQQFKKADFKKKQKEVEIDKGTKIVVKDKKKQKLNNGLTLLKQSSSNPNLRTGMNEYNLEDYGSIKEKSRKVDKIILKK